MLTVEEYFGPWISHPDATPERHFNAENLVNACNRLEEMARADGVEFPEHPRTSNKLHWGDVSDISGETYGGFRPQSCPIGAPGSSHKDAEGVDRYDPYERIDSWCIRNQDKLRKCGIHIEHPSATPGWSHWTTRAPRSGRTVFYP